MTNYREVLRLRSLGLKHSQIAKSMAIARQTVARISQRELRQCGRTLRS